MKDSSQPSVGNIMWLILLGVVAVQSALVPRDIPVKVIYEDFSRNLKNGVGNLKEKVQLPHDELVKQQLRIKQSLESGQKNIVEMNELESVYVKGNKNLNEKVQLAPTELSQATKHIPEKTQVLQKTTNEPNPIISLIKTAEQIVYSGLNGIRDNTGKIAIAPSEESWRNLNKTVEDFFQEQYRNVSDLKQDQQNQIIQNIANFVSNATGNFFQAFQQNNQVPANGTEDEQPGIFQSFTNYFSGGVQQLVNNIQNLGNQPANGTVLGDTGVTTQRPNVFVGIVSQVAQLISGNQGQQNLNQSDTGGSQGQQGIGGFFQGAANQFNQFVNNLSGQGQKPPQGSEDEGSASTQPPNFIQNVFQNINPFRPQNQANNPIVQGIQNASKPLQQIIPNNSFVVETQNVANQFQQQISQAGNATSVNLGQEQIAGQLQQLVPGGSSTQKPKE